MEKDTDKVQGYPPEEFSEQPEHGDRRASGAEKPELEKGDLTAMILSAMLVFGPIFLVLGGILAAAWVLLR